MTAATAPNMATHLQVLIRAKVCVLAIRSKEERRIEALIRSVADSLPDPETQTTFRVRYWSCTQGVTELGDNGVMVEVDKDVVDADAILTHIAATEERVLFVLRDFHPYLKDGADDVHRVRRRLRELIRLLKGKIPSVARAVILLSPVLEIPPELDGEIHVVEWPLPTREELDTLVVSAIKSVKDPQIKAAASKVDRARVVNAAVGLTMEQAHAAIAMSLVDKRTLDPALIADEKKNAIGDDGVLEWLEPLKGGLSEVGGLDVMKEFALERQEAFSPEAKAYGLDPQKGMLVFGVPGGGKTLFSRAVAGQYGFFAVRLVVANLFVSDLGGTEARWRMARKRMNILAPIVVLIDEGDKAGGSGGGGERDGGTSERFMGEFLTWLQEPTDAERPVYKIMTMNNIEQVAVNRPELLRVGRWDAMFFVDLPTLAERAAVIEIHVKKRYRDTPQRNFDPIDAKRVAAATPLFSPAELEGVVARAMHRGYQDGRRPTATEDLLQVASEMQPLAKTADLRIANMRAWAKTRAVRASREEPTELVGEAGSFQAVV